MENSAHDPNDHERLFSQLVSTSRITILGEMHGNSNSPEAALNFARAVLAAHGAVTVGLEIPAEDQQRLERFLSSEGTDGDRQSVLSSPFWSPNFVDGRSSQAKLQMLEELRQLKEAGEDVDILAFDARQGVTGPAAAEWAMAELVVARAEAEPTRRLVVLTGNFHARKALVDVMNEPVTPMAKYIVSSVDDTISIRLGYDGGTTLARTQAGFGPLELLTTIREREGLHRYEADDDAYDFEWILGPGVTSEPAHLLLDE